MSTIRCLRTYRLPERPSLIWLELETSDGLVGLGETFRGAASVEAVPARGARALAAGARCPAHRGISRHLLTPYRRLQQLGRRGARGQCGRHRAVGPGRPAPGRARARSAGRRVAHRASGLQHLRRLRLQQRHGRRRAIGATSEPRRSGPYDDQVAFMRDAGALAESLLVRGLQRHEDLALRHLCARQRRPPDQPARPEAGLEPFRKIRDAVGDRIEVMASCTASGVPRRRCGSARRWRISASSGSRTRSARWTTSRRWPTCAAAPACRSAAARRWAARAASATAGRDALDIVMLDLAWCGGLTEGRKIAALAEA